MEATKVGDVEDACVEEDLIPFEIDLSSCSNEGLAEPFLVVLPMKNSMEFRYVRNCVRTRSLRVAQQEEEHGDSFEKQLVVSMHAEQEGDGASFSSSESDDDQHSTGEGGSH